MAVPVRRESVPDLVFAEIREAILSGRYGPGQRLPTQRTLASELGVNMASVREALKRLQQLRMVEVRQGDATRVLDWRTSGGLEALALLGSFDDEVISSLFEARRLLLVEAGRLAAERRSDEQAVQLTELAAAMDAIGDIGARLITDWTFMETIVEASGNLVFRLIMNSVREIYLPNARLFAAVVAAHAELVPLYARIAAAIAAREPTPAAEAIAELAAAQERRVHAVT